MAKPVHETWALCTEIPTHDGDPPSPLGQLKGHRLANSAARVQLEVLLDAPSTSRS